MATLIDDGSQPTLRHRIGHLLSTCTSADIAVSHVRLAMLDLTEPETGGVQRCRILLGRLEARALTDLGHVDRTADMRMRALLSFLDSGRVEIRSAGLGAWSPDFSVYRGLRDGDDRGACLIGAHWFREPITSNGPSFTTLLTDPVSVARALARFDALWERSHDVLDPVLTAVRRRHSFSAA